MTGIISNFIIFPPIILATVLFRKSKPMGMRDNRVDKGLKIGESFNNYYAA